MFELEANLEAGEDSLGAVGGSFWVWLLLSRVPLCCGWKGNPKENRTPNRRHTLLGTGGKCECRGLPNFHMPWVRKIEPNSSSGRVPSLTKHTFSYYMGVPQPKMVVSSWFPSKTAKGVASKQGAAHAPAGSFSSPGSCANEVSRCVLKGKERRLRRCASI